MSYNGIADVESGSLRLPTRAVRERKERVDSLRYSRSATTTVRDESGQLHRLSGKAFSFRRFVRSISCIGPLTRYIRLFQNKFRLSPAVMRPRCHAGEKIRNRLRAARIIHVMSHYVKFSSLSLFKWALINYSVFSIRFG